MKFNKKISCFILALTLGFIPSISNIKSNISYASENNDIINEEDERKKNEREQKERDYYSAIDLIPKFQNLTSNSKDTIEIDVKNIGGYNFEKAKIQITSLPSELSLVNESSPVKEIGHIVVGNTKQIVYDVEVNKNAKSGNYPITFEFTANNGTDVSNFKEYKFSKTFYIRINKNETTKDNIQYKPFIIQNIEHPAIINKGDVADLSFSIKNPNNVDINSVKISISPDDGIVNQTQNVFVENNFPANGEKTFNVKIFAQEKAEKKNYSIKLTVEPTNPNEQVTNTTDSNSTDESEKSTKTLATSTQYTGIFYNAPEKNETDGVKNPYIMISSYSYGDKAVEPNGQFPLTMRFVNTSSQKTIRNIKISLTADDGTFIAVNSSNSFFINSMEPNSSVSKTINFTTKPDAPTKTVGMSIDYSYEDVKGNALTAKDNISIPVMQKTLLSIDDVMQPQYVVEGEPITVSLNFYNLGKTQISNLKMVASGDFSVQGENSYFVGNLDPGKNDSFSFSVIPNDYQKLSGVINFSYETLDGKVNTTQKTFDFKLNPTKANNFDSNTNGIDEPVQKNYTKYYIGGGVILLVITIVVIKRINSKKKKLQELDLDE